MGWEPLRSLIGPEGQQGVKGDKGDPGVDSVPAAEAVATYMDTEGNPVHDATLDLIAARISAEVVFSPVPTPPATPGVSAWGDSLTESGLNTDSWVALLGQQVALGFYNGGGWGQSSPQIAGRQGGQPPLVTLTGNQIPASGQVIVTYSSVNIFVADHIASRDGVIAGIPGTLSWDGTTTRFTRATPGIAVPVTAFTRFTPTDGSRRREWAQIIWAGRNGGTDPAPNLDSVNRMIGYGNGRFLVLQIPPAMGWPDASAINYAFRERWPDNYVPIADWLRSTAAATAVGITFTSGDNTDIANGLIPTSFRADAVHLNSTGRKAVALRLREELIARGWATQYAAPVFPAPLAQYRWEFGAFGPLELISSVQPVEGQVAIAASADAQRPGAVQFAVFKRRHAQFGVGHRLIGALPSSPTVFTAQIVGKFLSTTANNILAGVCGVNLHVDSSGKVRAYTPGGNILSVANADTNVHVYTIVANGASSALWIDGVKATGTLVPSSANVNVGNVDAVSTSQVANLNIWTSALSDADIGTVRTAAAASYIS